MNKTRLKRKKSYRRIGRRMTVTTALDKAHKELAIMKAVNHPNVVNCFEIIDDPEADHLFLGVYRTVSGSVLHALAHSDPHPVPPSSMPLFGLL